MIMDDDEMVRDIAREMLSILGHEVVEACDGEEAVALFIRYRNEGNPIDVIIMDLTIPGGMGGKEAVGEILALDPGARVVVSSGYSSDPVMASYKEYGFLAAVAKPYQMQDLAQGIEACLTG
jgi:CheY-like chemotaxis protein